MTHAELIKRLESWFNKKITGEQYELYKKRIDFIPVKALIHIVDEIIDDNPPNPSRFPTAKKIMAGWYAWKQANPQKVFLDYESDCKYCNSHGFLWFQKFDHEMGYKVKYVGRCPMCENWKSDVGKQSPVVCWTKEEIHQRGYELF